ncbi:MULTISPECIES: aminotransferase class V-fold PLP-dependent enzyme [unclassified Brevundimonas]|uniref:aminotransferase class V-fold PLP-dependent enzyme n=1 Tax=unclassified Brevundimonas TaxID=2622653 RepID=UPI0025C42202|nr:MULTISPECIES: aminotransferase class V-fold PLP-dependent enzyme [unclassified Brevundimonas]
MLKHRFTRALSLDPQRLHFAAHSHHLWPDVTFDAQVRAWAEANHYADRKWDLVFGEVIPAAQNHVARQLGLPSGDSIVFSPNTHDLLLRVVSAVDGKPVRILSTDGEFHSFRRQAERWEEAGDAVVTRIPLTPIETFEERFLQAATAGGHDLIFVSQVFFRTGQVSGNLAPLAALSKPEGPWVVIDGYHGFMATPTDLSAIGDRVFYLAGGYKYAMAGEGACFLHAPQGFGSRPVVTGWFAEFGDLEGPPGGVGYRTDGGRFWGATFDASALYRFNAVQEMLGEEGLGVGDLAAHSRDLMQRFQQAMRGDTETVLGQADWLNPVEGDGPRARFLAIQHPKAADVRSRLIEQNIITDVRDDVIRFGFGPYQDQDDVERLIQACHQL